MKFAITFDVIAAPNAPQPSMIPAIVDTALIPFLASFCPYNVTNFFSEIYTISVDTAPPIIEPGPPTPTPAKKRRTKYKLLILIALIKNVKMRKMTEKKNPKEIIIDLI